MKSVFLCPFDLDFSYDQYGTRNEDFFGSNKDTRKIQKVT